MYKVQLKKKVEKDLEQLDKYTREKVLKLFVYLSLDPFYGKPLKGKLKGTYGVRIWPYRVFYKIYKEIEVIYILRISHRQNAYK